jgi:hypothetical protein
MSRLPRRKRTDDEGPPAVVAGEAAAAAVDVEPASATPDLRAAAFFDIDNTVVRGASLFHLARGLASRKFFTATDVAAFAWKQAKYRVAGREDADDIASAIDAALSFVAGHTVDEVTRLGDEIFDERTKVINIGGGQPGVNNKTTSGAVSAKTITVQ